MKPTSFKETNTVLESGNNPNTGQLPVSIAFHPDNKGVPSMISKWKLSPEEIERINETGEIWIGILGIQMPPIFPTVFNPFDEIGYKPYEQE